MAGRGGRWIGIGSRGPRSPPLRGRARVHGGQRGAACPRDPGPGEARDIGAERPLARIGPFVTFYKLGTNPAQSGVGTLVRIAWTPRLVDSNSLLSLSTTLKDLITPKAATWLEELFWGRRHVLSLSAGSAGSLALYSILLDQRDRVIRLARDFSILAAEFADSDHLRIEEISPSAATRRPSRVRAGAETVGLALGGGEGLIPRC